MTVDRLMRGGMIVLAAALCACAKSEVDDDRAATDTASASAAPSTAPAATPAASAVDSAQWVLRADGAGPLRVGMTVDEANQAVAGGLDRTAGLEACDYVRPKNGPAGLGVMMENGRIARVDVDSAGVATAAGVRPGDTEARVREAYPNARVQPHKYDDRGRYFVVLPATPADTLHRIVFETDGSVVLRMRGGVFPAVEYVEGCS
ncbi:MAG TPA: hypothetical protein VEX86_05485 [Longimicrobium sp.]|nr:hypothetical protein [Longimicrobium sp.]